MSDSINVNVLPLVTVIANFKNISDSIKINVHLSVTDRPNIIFLSDSINVNVLSLVTVIPNFKNISGSIKINVLLLVTDIPNIIYIR